MNDIQRQLLLAIGEEHREQGPSRQWSHDWAADPVVQRCSIYADWLEENGQEASFWRAVKMLPPMAEMLGAEIRGLAVDDECLLFYTDQGDFCFEVSGECCSTSWFSDLEGCLDCVGGIIDCVTEKPLEGYNVDDGRCRQESDVAYGYEVHTTKGPLKVVFRNSSNGYYGGEMSRSSRRTEDYKASMKLLDTVNEWRNESSGE